MHWDIRPHIGTTKSNIQAVDKHLNRMGLLICAAVKEVNNKYLSYVESNNKIHAFVLQQYVVKIRTNFLKKSGNNNNK